MGSAKSVPARTEVPEGKTRICVAGFGISHHTNRAGKLARAIAAAKPQEYETWFYFDTNGYRPAFLEAVKKELSEEQQEKFAGHRTSPFCWLETTEGKSRKLDAKGGRDNLVEWAKATFPDVESIMDEAKEPSIWEAYVDQTPGTAQEQKSEK